MTLQSRGTRSVQESKNKSVHVQILWDSLKFCMYLLHPFTSHEGSHMLAVKLRIDLKQLEKLVARPDAFRSLPTSCEVCRWPCRMKHVIMHIHCVTCTYMVINAASWTPQGKGMNNYCPSASYCEVCKTALCRAGASWNNTLECKQKPTTCLERALRLVKADHNWSWPHNQLLSQEFRQG